MKKLIFSALLTASLGMLPCSAAVDCVGLTLTVKNSVVAEPTKVLEIVAAQVGAAPNCACEVVKTAIESSKANSKMVASIVEAAAIAAPDQLRLVSQCAVAVAPDALVSVQAVVAKLDPNLGESAKSSKSSKSPAGEVASMPNPLDFPGQGPIGPTPGGPGGMPLIPQLPPVIIAPPEVIVPPPVTKVNP